MMSAVQIDHPDGIHTLIIHGDNNAIIRIETNITYPGWIEIGNIFNDTPIMIGSEVEWDALIEMINLADTVQKQAWKARNEFNGTNDG